MTATRIALAAIAALLCAGPPAALARTPAPAPVQSRQVVRDHAMVSAANPLAAEAGIAILKQGGNAVDAAVAIQAVLGLVEPQSSGLGGGAYLTYYDARTGQVTDYTGRETAPAAAGPDFFLQPDGKPMPFFQAVLSGKSTGAPGVVAMLALAHDQHGRLPWSRLFGGAADLAEKGFEVSPRLAGYAAGNFPQAKAPDIWAYLSRPDGSRIQAGDILKNPAYARTLRLIAAEGPSAFYEGPIARDIAQRVRKDPGGVLTEADIAAYRAKATPGLCAPYRIWVVCTPQPSSSGVSLLEMLGLLERTDIDRRGPGDPVAWFEMAQAMRLAYADRDRWIGDPAFVKVPARGLLSAGYLDARAGLIGQVAGPAPEAGIPPGAPAAGADATTEAGGTSHFVVVDHQGNVVSMTTSVESVFGSGRMVDGFVLNNQLTDFSFLPRDRAGRPAANAVAAGKRPRSAMSPVVVLDRNGRFVAALGSPGGPAILAYNLKTLVGVLDWKLSMQRAIALPNLIAIGDRYGAEVEKFPPGVLEGLKARGITLQPGRGENSGLHGVIVRGGRLEGGADPRREGVVLTD
jgi:gamma-glutamyltranspeptidase/glutathione hydrolase